MGKEQDNRGKIRGEALLQMRDSYEKGEGHPAQEPGQKIHSPSAPGKRDRSDEKVTDLLYECYGRASRKEEYRPVLDKIKARYQEIIDELELSVSLDKEFQMMEQAFISGAGEKYAASRGEYLNGILLAAFLGYEFVDAAEVIRFDRNGNF